jgi:23S rRNA (guanosine2251-2'-O)-methyltransferase
VQVRRDEDRGPLPFVATRASWAYARVDRLPVVVLLYNVRSLYNVGAFFRTADAARLREVLLAGITGAPPHPGIAKTALGAERTVRWRRVDNAEQILVDLARSGWEVVAVETTTHAIDLFDWRPAFPVCVVFGHEIEGLPASILERCDFHVRIPTLGVKQSLNVATAGGIVIYELLRHYRDRVLCESRVERRGLGGAAPGGRPLRR